MKFAPEGRPFLALGGVILVVLAFLAWKRGGGWYVPLVIWIPVSVCGMVILEATGRETF